MPCLRARRARANVRVPTGTRPKPLSPLDGAGTRDGVPSGPGGEGRASGRGNDYPETVLPRHGDRAELLAQPQPVVLDPVFRQLAAGKAADDDARPGHLAPARGDPLPRTALGSTPAATPHAPVAREEEVVQREGRVREAAKKPAIPSRQAGSPRRVVCPIQWETRSAVQYWSRPSRSWRLKTSAM